MKSLLLLLFAFCFAAMPVRAATLDAAEAEALRNEVSVLSGTFARGDAEAIIARTHQSLIDFAGGREALLAATREGLVQLKAAGARFTRYDVGTPTRLWDAGDEVVCFVPTDSLLALHDAKVHGIGFMIAVRPRAGGTWMFMDGAGLRERPDLLHVLLPALDRAVELPRNTVEIL